MDDEQTIKAAVEERKLRARTLGLVDTLFRLYWKELHYLGSNADYDTARLPNGATAQRFGSPRSSSERVTVYTPDDTFDFVWSVHPDYLPEDDGTRFADLKLHIGGETVLQISCVHTPHKYTDYNDWEVSRHSDVEAFREGPWVQAFVRLAAQINSKAGQIRTEGAKDDKQRELEDLKKKFGITILAFVLFLSLAPVQAQTQPSDTHRVQVVSLPPKDNSPQGCP
jgi:hypothetical protein